MRCRSPRLFLFALASTVPVCSAGEMLKNGGFEGTWRPLKSAYPQATASGQVPAHWSDVSTWSGASTRYTRVPGHDREGHALRLEMVEAAKRHSVLQLRSEFPVKMEAGKAYGITARLRSPTHTLVRLEIRQHQPPRIRFWQTAVRAGEQWRRYRFVAEPEDTGEARFFVLFRQVGVVEVDDLSMRELAEDERPAAQAPHEIRGARCVSTRGEVIRRSDVIAMYHEHRPDVIRKYRIDVVAWGSQLRADEKVVDRRRQQIQAARAAGVRLHAVDCALVQEGGRCIVSQGQRGSPHVRLFWQLRKDNEGTLKRLDELGVRLTDHTSLAIDGAWLPVPWLRRRWRIPLASVYSPTAKRWFMEQMDAIARTGLTALHFDEPGMGAYGLLNPTPGDFSDHAMEAFREWLRQRPANVWRDAGIESLDRLNYRDFVRAKGCAPARAPLWREFVRFQLFTTAAHVRELRDRVRAKVRAAIPLSMNANASSWIKLPFLEVQDFATTEVAHEARSRKPPTAPLLVYKLADAFRQPVASTAHGGDWYEMKVDQHPLLVSAWVAMGYALGHQLMIPYRAWVMDPVKGSDTYRAVTDHYACLAHFVKRVAPLLDRHEAVSAVAVLVACDAIEQNRRDLDKLAAKLADANIPFCVAVEGNDLLPRHVAAHDLAGCSAVLIACPPFVEDQARARIAQCAGGRPVVEHYGGPLPGVLPKPISVTGARGVWVLPRAVPADATAPVAVHLLNRDYDAQARQMRAKDDFTVTLDTRLFSGRQFSSAALHQPRLLAKLPSDPETATVVPVALKQDSKQIEIRIRGLELWGIVELK